MKDSSDPAFSSQNFNLGENSNNSFENKNSYEFALDLYQQGHLEQSLELLKQLSNQNPDSPKLWNLMAIITSKLNENLKACHIAMKAVNLAKHPTYYLTFAECLKRANKTKSAICIYNEVLKIDKNNISALENLASIYMRNNELNNSRECYLKLLNLNYNKAQILNNLGCIEAFNQNNDKAMQYFQQSINEDDNFCDAYNNIGNILNQNEQYFEALKYYDKAISINSEYADAYANKGYCLLNLENFQAAKTYLSKALSISPNNYKPNFHIAEAFKAMGNYDKAIEYYQKAIILNQYDLRIPLMMGEAYRLNGQLKEALSSYEKSLEIEPQNPTAQASRLAIAQKLVMWDKIEPWTKELIASCESKWALNQHTYVEPFVVLSLDCPPSFQLQIAKDKARYVNGLVKGFPKIVSRSKILEKRNNQDKIRIGYISPDFNDHPVGLLLRDTFKYHNRDKFEIFCYSIGKPSTSRFEIAIKESCDVYRDLYQVDSYKIAKRIADDGIDILIDLAAYTGNSRPLIMAFKPAPIQCHHLGYSTSMGSDFVNYFITDDKMVPNEYKSLYTEQLVYLPYAHCTPLFEKPESNISRDDFGLPNDKFIYCCFNLSYRIEPRAFEAWMEILDNTPNSILWLRADSDEIKSRYRIEANRRKIDPDRLYFLNPVDLTKDWPMRLADVWLDTLVVSSNTAVFLCANVGLPMITLKGNTPQARSSASLAKASFMDDLVANNIDEYKSKAIELYSDKYKLSSLRQNLEKLGRKSELFDIKSYINNLENELLKLIAKEC